MTIIGIDLGTTNSCVAYFDKGNVNVFENISGRYTTPSYIAFAGDEYFVGNEAKNHCLLDPFNVVFDAKRLIGRRFDDSYVQQDIKRNWPFTVLNEEGSPMVEVKYTNIKRTFIPEFISAKVLEFMKEIAESKTGIDNITSAVVTVPAYFNDSQRQATRAAAEIAGFKIIRLINEPTAAAIAYIFKNKDIKESNIVVYDLGGGTFDVSVLTVSDGRIIVKAVNGDTNLGGNDFDKLLAEHFLCEIEAKKKKSFREKDYTASRFKLLHACENVKVLLSQTYNARIGIAALFDGEDFNSSITRATFEDLCDEKMRQTIGPIEQALKDANLTVKDINQILLIGGSTRIPKIQMLIKELFGEIPLNRCMNADQAVAEGAAIFAAMLQSDDNKELVGIKLTDVIPLSYGVEVKDKLMSVIIPRNTQYPIKKTDTYFTTKDNQTIADINVYQGERELVTNNHLLASFQLRNLPPKLAREVNVDITMEIDENGILIVTVVEQSTGVTASKIIANSLNRLSKEKIKELIAESERMKAHDMKYKEFIIAKNKLESFINDLKIFLKYNDNNDDYVKQIVEDYTKWTKDNPNATKDDLDSILNTFKDREESYKPLYNFKNKKSCKLYLNH